MAKVQPGGDKDCSNSAPAPPALGVGGSEIRAQLQPWSRVVFFIWSWNFTKRKVVPPSASQLPQLFSSRPSYFPLFYNPPWFERQNITISNWCLIKLGSWWTKTISYQFRALLHTFQKKRNDQEPRTRLNISTSPKLNIFRVKLFQICPLFFQSRDCKLSHDCSSRAVIVSLVKIPGTWTLVPTLQSIHPSGAELDTLLVFPPSSRYHPN